MVDLSKLITHLQHLTMTAVSVGPLHHLVIRPREARRRVAQLDVVCCFDLDRDLDRARAVRRALNLVVRSTSGPFEPAEWPQQWRCADSSQRRRLSPYFESTSVTIVLIGSVTASRRHVQQMLATALTHQHAIVGLFVHPIADGDGKAGIRGLAPFVPAHIPFRTAVWTGNERQLIDLIDLAVMERCTTPPRPNGQGAVVYR